MDRYCLFCDYSNKGKHQIVVENKFFYSRFSDFPVSPGHCEIVSKKHIKSFFDILKEEFKSLFVIIRETKEVIDKKHNPDGYNIGINEGRAGGRTMEHFHLHLIPRFFGDVEDPKGGVRNVIPNKAMYINPYEKYEKDLL